MLEQAVRAVQIRYLQLQLVVVALVKARQDNPVTLLVLDLQQ
jgi:hypothetical protein